MTAGGIFRELLKREGAIRSLGVHDVFSAMIAEREGLELVFLGGFGAAASLLGLPDVGLITLSEMADAVRRICCRIRIPLVADGDTGHGDLPNVTRTVEEFEAAGAAGMLLEDQVFPKRCGHFVGKQVIPANEMARKLDAALAARRSRDFAIFARTDSLAIEGVDAAIRRAQLYSRVGADVCFVEAPTSLAELRKIASEVPGPQLANMLTGGATPIRSASELEAMGFKIVVCPIETLLATGQAIRRLTRRLLDTGRVDDDPGLLMSFDEVKVALGLPKILALSSKADPVGESDGRRP